MIKCVYQNGFRPSSTLVKLKNFTFPEKLASRATIYRWFKKLEGDASKFWQRPIRLHSLDELIEFTSQEPYYTSSSLTVCRTQNRAWLQEQIVNLNTTQPVPQLCLIVSVTVHLLTRSLQAGTIEDPWLRTTAKSEPKWSEISFLDSSD